MNNVVKIIWIRGPENHGFTGRGSAVCVSEFGHTSTSVYILLKTFKKLYPFFKYKPR